MDDIWIPDVIVLGPGGAKGYIELGFMLSLEEESYYNNVTEWIGCSIGSSIALMIVAGCPVQQIIDDCIDVNIINDITDINIEHINENPGIFTIKTIEDLMKRRITERFGMVPTLKQLHMATGVLLKLITFNRDKMRPECLSKDTEPNLSCVEAVMMSMAIPLLVTPRIYKGYTYVDGALGDPYPILISDDGTKKILGIYIDSENTNIPSDISVVMKWILHSYQCAQASMKVLRDNALRLASNNCRHVALKTPILDTTGMSFNREVKTAMIESGYKRGKVFMARIKHPDKYKLLLDDDEEIPIMDEINEIGIDEEMSTMIDILCPSTVDPISIISQVNVDPTPVLQPIRQLSQTNIITEQISDLFVSDIYPPEDRHNPLVENINK